MSATEVTERRWRLVTLTLLVLAGVLLVVLVATGAFLSTTYRPTVSQALGDAPGLDDDRSPARVVHERAARALGTQTLLIAVSAVGLTIVRWRRGRRAAGPLAGLLALAVFAAVISGYALPWDQLALWAVTIGPDARGVWFASFDDRVRYVLIDGYEFSQSAYAATTLIHVVLVPLVVFVLGALLLRSLRAARPTRDPDAGLPALHVEALTPDTPSTPGP